ncbi:diguanylate cyclase [Dactylosporangium sp. CA-152071]|uniref:diguanylate cyclase n=1 Tax=Dactylosporangium sp. CA-152071 TaxID=3239933 RepID=UPI003D9392FC
MRLGQASAGRPSGLGRLLIAGLVCAEGAVVACDAAEVFSLAAAATVSWCIIVGNLTLFTVISHRVVTALPAGDPRRLFWKVSRLAGGLCTLGYAVHLVTVLDRPEQGLGEHGIAQAAAFVGMLMLALGLLMFPVARESRAQHGMFWLDVATVMVAVGAGGAYSAIGATAADHTVDTVFRVVVSQVLMMVVTLAVVKLAVSGTGPLSRSATVFAATAALLGGVSGTLHDQLVASGRSGIYLAIFLATNVGLTAVALAQQRSVSSPGGASRRRRPFSRLPYLAVAFVFVLLSFSLVRDGIGVRTWVVVGAAALVTALVIVRQLTSFADNARLLSALERSLAEREALTRALHNMAYSDTLTGLDNRPMFMRTLDAALQAERDSGRCVAVVLIDLDDFKPVNDQHGHAAGDAVLREVGARLRACAREEDGVARLGGDEFALVLDWALTSDALVALATRVRDAVAQPIQVASGVWTGVGASIGVATDRGGTCSSDELLQRADQAMYVAKRGGKNGFHLAGALPRDVERFVPEGVRSSPV